LQNASKFTVVLVVEFFSQGLCSSVVCTAQWWIMLLI